MTKEEIIDFCEMKSQLEPENEDIFNNIIELLEQEDYEDVEYKKDVNKLKEQILKEGNTLVFKQDLLERFVKIDKEYKGRPWNLLQILANINILIGQQPSEDCVSRKSLLDKLDPLYKEKIKTAPDNMAEGFLQVEKLIKQEPSVTPTQEWIPVSERLPKTDGVYDVTRRLFDNQIDIEPYYIVDACYFDGTNTWHNDNRINHNRHPLDDIIAWMPKPKSYKAEKEIE